MGGAPSPPQILLERDSGYAVLTLPGLGKDNTLTEGAASRVEEALATLQAERRVTAVILMGPPQRAFCRGFATDKASSAVPTILGRLRRHPVSRLCARLAAYEGVTIAALNGDAFGAGLALALACDMRLAAEGARLGFPAEAAGRMFLPEGIQRLVRLGGEAHARELVLSGEPIGAETARRWGLIAEVVPPVELLPRATALAQELSRRAPWALRTIKEAVLRGRDLPLHEAIALEVDLYMLLHTTKDRLEGIRAFGERRPPQFTGT